MKLVGLTGGIGSGKSTVSRFLAELGAVIIDADQVARDLQQAGSPMVAAIAEAFGDDVIAADGNLDRARVAALVFGDTATHKANRLQLNALTHPAIHAEIERQISSYAATDHVVILDHPLLTERPRDDLDEVIVVDIAVETQVDRLVSHRGLDESDARARIASQASREQRLELASLVIDNRGDIEALKRQVVDVWQQLND